MLPENKVLILHNFSPGTIGQTEAVYMQLMMQAIPPPLGPFVAATWILVDPVCRSVVFLSHSSKIFILKCLKFITKKPNEFHCALVPSVFLIFMLYMFHVTMTRQGDSVLSTSQWTQLLPNAGQKTSNCYAKINWNLSSVDEKQNDYPISCDNVNWGPSLRQND